MKRRSVAADVLPIAFCADCAGLEIVCGFQVFSVNIGTGTLTPVVNSAPPLGSAAPLDGLTAIADYDHDGDLDGIISANRQLGGGAPTDVQVYAWDLQTPTVLATSPIINSISFGTIGQATVADFDGDNLIEIAVASQDSFYVFDDFQSGMNSLWTQSIIEGSGFNGSAAFDFDGNNAVDLVYSDEEFLYVYDGATGNVLFSDTCRGGTYMEKPLVADIDGDAQAEIVCACSENPDFPVPPATVTNFSVPRFHGFLAAYGHN